MANAIFKRGTSAEIDDIAISDGQVLWTTDLGVSNKIYNDVGTNRVPIGGNVIEGGKYEEFTYVVDSDTALNNWANNVRGNDYTSVLIRKGTWKSDSGINLQKAGTKRIVGENGNLLYFTNQSSDGLPSDGLYYTGGKPSVFVSQVDLQFTKYIIGVNVCGSYEGFRNCENLINCTARVIGSVDNDYYSSYSGCIRLLNCKASNNGFTDCSYLTNCNSNYKYKDCDHLENCHARIIKLSSATTGIKRCAYENCSYLTNCVDETSKIDYKYTDIHSFDNCDNLINCSIIKNGYVKLGSHGFDSCRHLVNCKSSYEYSGFANCYSVSNCDSLGDVSAYTDSYASSSKISTYACADTPNGGFNSETTK